MLLHIIDAERVFAYRALRFARKDSTNLPGFEHNDYVKVSHPNNRSKASLLKEYKRSKRNQLWSCFQTSTKEMLLRIGTASDNQMSVRALGFVIAGHETHHCKHYKGTLSIVKLSTNCKNQMPHKLVHYPLYNQLMVSQYR